MLAFALGVLSSLVATIVYVVSLRVSLRWWRAYPRGIRLVAPDREWYLKRIADLIRSNKNRLFYKGFTGFDLFSSEVIKSAFDETRTDNWSEFVFVLTEPNSPAFDSERNRYYTRAHLEHLQETVRQYLQERLLPCVRVRDGGTCGVFWIPEEKNFQNVLILDDEAFIFLRGFTETKGPAGQIIVNVTFSKAPELVRELLLFMKERYLRLARAMPSSDGRVVSR